MTEQDSHIARCFNAGCDARLAGRPMSENPYVGDSASMSAWRQGWRNVAMSWGSGVVRRWPFRQLPVLGH